jgi:hypothetical protein
MKLLLGLLVSFVIADGFLTHFLITGGIATEGNPFLQPIVGDAGFIFLKIAGALLCAVILWDIYRRYPRVALFSTSCFVVIYAGIVLWNIGVALTG